MTNEFLKRLEEQYPERKNSVTKKAKDFFAKVKKQRDARWEPAPQEGDNSAVINLSQKIVDLLGLIPSPAAAAGKLGVGLVGAITPGGLRKLALTHNTRAPGLERILDTGRIDIPSMAVTANKPANNFGEVTLVMDPRKFDPAVNRRSQMFNRDAYTPDRRQFLQFYNRDADVLSARDVRLLQEAEPGFMQELAIKASPSFTFKSYQKSPAGVGTLFNKERYVTEADVLDAVPEMSFLLGASTTGQPRFLPGTAGEVYSRLIKSAGSGNEKAIKVLKRLKQGKSDYAEVKVTDSISAGPENILGVIFPGGYSLAPGNTTAALMQDLTSLRIPSGRISDLLAPEAITRRRKAIELKAPKWQEEFESILKEPSTRNQLLTKGEDNKYVAAADFLTQKLGSNAGGSYPWMANALVNEDRYSLVEGLLDSSLQSPSAMDEVIQSLTSRAFK